MNVLWTEQSCSCFFRTAVIIKHLFLNYQLNLSPLLGFDGMVQIYNTASWRPELVEFQPLFVHRGHMMSDDQFDTSSAVVTTHVWHPSRPRTVLSAAVDGSVHVWDWVDKATASC